MTNGLFKLGWADLAKGFVMAVIAAVIAYFTDASALSAPDWNYILKLSLTAGFSYLAKNFISTSDGKVLGRVG